jgi:hypothetical protein
VLLRIRRGKEELWNKFRHFPCGYGCYPSLVLRVYYKAFKILQESSKLREVSRRRGRHQRNRNGIGSGIKREGSQIKQKERQKGTQQVLRGTV